MFPCNAYYCPIAWTALHFAQVLEIQNSFLWTFFFNLFHVVYIHKLYLIAICTYIPMFISHVHKSPPTYLQLYINISNIFIWWIVLRSIKYLSIFWLHSSWWFPDFAGPPLRGRLSFSRGLPDPEAKSFGALLAISSCWPIPSCLFRKASNLIDKAESKTGFDMIYIDSL